MIKALSFLLLCGAVAGAGEGGQRWRWPDGSTSSPARAANVGNTDYNAGSSAINDKLLFHEENVKRPRAYEDNDGTIDSVPRCKCVYAKQCNGQIMPGECGAGKNLCCFERQDISDQQHHASSQRQPLKTSVLALKSRNFEDSENSNLRYSNGGHLSSSGSAGIASSNSNYLRNFPNSESQNRILGLNNQNKGVLVGPGGPTGIVGPNHRVKDVLVGPGGPTGNIGPNYNNKNILVGPGGPTGNIGPNYNNKNILVGPGGPTGNIGPNYNNRNVLIGPGGPTGNIGPNYKHKNILIGASGATGNIGSNYHPEVLVGPEGPTGNVGPNYNNKNVLVGPGGPTGNIGPIDQNKGILVGPGGPTGKVGPNQRQTENIRREVLGGPDEPTENIRTNYRSKISNQQVLLYPSRFNSFGGLNNQKQFLVGSNPVGNIGPNQQVLGFIVGPSGLTGEIGPNNNRKEKSSINVSQKPNSFQLLNNIVVVPTAKTGMVISGLLLNDQTGFNGFKGSGSQNRAHSRRSRLIFPEDDSQGVRGHSVGEKLMRPRNGRMFLGPSAAYIALL